ncbi:MAG: polysaccharide pyruvyl transferase family protein [Bacteroidales bacterium]|nr:polysaccharide pyruvyl transferase family protein [Bacteroidales bacterium]
MSSTRQWNPDDEFIRTGIKRLLASLIGPDHNWVLWNRNPDLFYNRWDDGRMRTDFLTNSLRDPALDQIDLVVFAGTPEWTGPPVDRVYRTLLTFPQIPVLVLGVGSGGDTHPLADHEIAVLDRENVLITTRSPDLADQLNSQLCQPKAIPLPCPAFYSGQFRGWPDHRRHGIIVQSSGTANQQISETLVQDLLTALRAADTTLPLDIISFYIDEFMRFSRLGFHSPCIYSYEPDDLLAALSQYSLLISTRLHGAIAGLSAGVPSILIADANNFRIRSTQRLFGKLLPVLTVPEAFNLARHITNDELHDRSQAIQQFQAESFAQLSGLVNTFLKKYLPGAVRDSHTER